MWADINGERKKVACGPCIRGHRSSKCDHRDRVLVEVRKPGRPLSSCPHPSGSCSCERVVINYTIPKTSECACPSDRAQAVVSAAGPSSRVQKSRRRKSTNATNPSLLEKSIKAIQGNETDSSSLLTRMPANPSFTPSDKSTSNGASPSSSASSTPRMPPSPSRKQSQASDLQLPDALVARSNYREVSDCCRPQAPQHQPEPVPQRQGGSCCGGEVKELPKPSQPQKACCSGNNQPPQINMYPQPNRQQTIDPNYPQIAQLQRMHFQPPRYGLVNQGFSVNMPNNMGMALPYGFNTPIYNHMSPGFQQAPSVPITPGAGHTVHNTEHNCHCGESCSCFGCAAHPNNATMMEYIYSMNQYMSTGEFGTFSPPTYDLPTQPHHPGFGAEAAQGMAFHAPSPSANFAQYTPGQMSLRAEMNASMGIPNTPVGITSPWQQTPAQHPLQPPSTANHSCFNIINSTQDTPLDLKKEEPPASSAIVDSPSDGQDEDSSTLSPSSYFWQELVLPCCNDPTGTCQCGDGCECVGCLTHGGHNGVPLEHPSAAEQEAFNEFLVNTHISGNDSNMMAAAFSEVPS